MATKMDVYEKLRTVIAKGLGNEIDVFMDDSALIYFLNTEPREVAITDDKEEAY